MSRLQDYIQARRVELIKQVQPDFLQVLESGFDLIEFKLEEAYPDMFGPKITRRVELLEVLLFSFINHCANPESLDEMEQYLSEIKTDKKDGMFH